MYTHKVQYYETDRMGVTHHSNYVRWMEEARIDYLEKLGYGYDRLEEEGIISPILSVECNYRKSTTFSDEVDIEVSVEEYKGIRITLKYVMTNKEGEVVCEGRTGLCFLNRAGKPVRMAKEFPEFHALLTDCLEQKPE